ncbi:creatininase family protein [Cupriavidus lacunae]|uniref:creatininase family protein n=1 Tax=Cupriavidus lacunae TaxID=2666307 RepID=UPI001FC9E7E1|nr:creatininase family protein [Cupriavidus lacunae]
MKKVFLNEFSTAELEAMFAAGDIDSAITVFGSCESHGGHLPLGPDLFVPTEVAGRPRNGSSAPSWSRACRSAPRCITTPIRWRSRFASRR